MRNPFSKLGKGAFDVQFVDKHKDREERRLRVHMEQWHKSKRHESFRV